MHYRWNAYAVDGTRPTLSDKNGGPRIEPSKDFTEVNYSYNNSPSARDTKST